MVHMRRYKTKRLQHQTIMKLFVLELNFMRMSSCLFKLVGKHIHPSLHQVVWKVYFSNDLSCILRPSNDISN